MMRLPVGLAVVIAAGCGGGEDGYVEPAFEVGFVVEGDFHVLVEGDPCPVFHGIQGGYWMMPMLRTQGIGERPEVACVLDDLDDGVSLGEINGPRPFREVAGWDSYTLPLPMLTVFDDEDLAALDGHVAAFACSVANDEVDLAFEREVVLLSVL